MRFAATKRQSSGWSGDLGLGILALAVIMLVGIATVIVLAILVFGFTMIGRDAARASDERGQDGTASEQVTTHRGFYSGMGRVRVRRAF